MNAVFDWVRGIVFYLILLTVVSHLVPGKKYEKYIRIFTGMLLVLIVIQPIRAFKGMDGSDTFESGIDKIFQEEIEMDDGFTQRLKEIPAETMEQELAGQMRTYCEQEASGYGFDIVNFDVQFRWEEEKVMPVRISMEVTQKEKGGEVMSPKVDIDKITVPDIVNGAQADTQETKTGQLCSAVADYYGLESGQVEIRGK